MNRHVGLHANRLSREPLETKFAKAWSKSNDNPVSVLLEWLLGDGSQRGLVSDRDCEVAATVIQWLGSSVGQSFLESVKRGKE